MGALSSWKTASMFGNNVWIMGCTWLPNLSHVLSCSNSVIKGNNETNRILYHDIAAQTITESLPCFTVITRLTCVFSKRKLFLSRKQREGRLIWPYHARISSRLMSRVYGRDTNVYASQHYFQ
jgi:hypothetical protein